MDSLIQNQLNRLQLVHLNVTCTENPGSNPFLAEFFFLPSASGVIRIRSPRIKLRVIFSFFSFAATEVIKIGNPQYKGPKSDKCLRQDQLNVLRMVELDSWNLY